MDIRGKTRKTIKTPDGYEVVIRKLNLFAFMETGSLPDILTVKNPEALTNKIQKDPNAIKSIMRICLVDGVVGGDLNISEKSPRDCSENELSYEEVPQDDAIFIINEVMDFSDMTGGVAEKAKPFSRKAKAANNNR